MMWIIRLWILFENEEFVVGIRELAIVDPTLEYVVEGTSDFIEYTPCEVTDEWIAM